MFRGPMMPDHHYHRLVDEDIVKVKTQNIFMILFDFEEYSFWHEVVCQLEL